MSIGRRRAALSVLLLPQFIPYLSPILAAKEKVFKIGVGKREMRQLFPPNSTFRRKHHHNGRQCWARARHEWRCCSTTIHTQSCISQIGILWGGINNSLYITLRENLFLFCHEVHICLLIHTTKDVSAVEWAYKHTKSLHCSTQRNGVKIQIQCIQSLIHLTRLNL